MCILDSLDCRGGSIYLYLFLALRFFDPASLARPFLPSFCTLPIVIVIRRIMSHNSNLDADFVHYLESMVNINALDRITTDLYDELQDSQQVMNQIKTMLDSLPKSEQNTKPEPSYSSIRHEELSNFLNDSPPQLLMPDMDQNPSDFNLNDAIAEMKSYVEEIKKDLVVPDSKMKGYVKRDLEDLDFEKYASSLDVLCKRLSNIKQIKKEDGIQRNPELEAKLAVIHDDVNMFTKVPIP